MKSSIVCWDSGTRWRTSHNWLITRQRRRRMPYLLSTIPITKALQGSSLSTTRSATALLAIFYFKYPQYGPAQVWILGLMEWNKCILWDVIHENSEMYGECEISFKLSYISGHTGSRKVQNLYFFIGLRYQYYTSSKHIIIFLTVFVGDLNVSLQFEKRDN